MRTLIESLKALDEHYLETLKYVGRNFDVNLEMLQNNSFNPTLYGEAKMIEDFINSFEVKLKEDSIITMARFQPAAKNLRKLVMIINSVRVLERMGDLLKANLTLIKDIEKKSPNLAYAMNERVLPIAKKIRGLFGMYVEAFLNEDVSLLYNILYLDEEIDDLIDENTAYFLGKMKETPENVVGGSELMLLDKKFERLSDHIIHLASDLIYILNGENTRKAELESQIKTKK
ncbi:MAG: phosphate signaling complex PhoU family protein [Cetobacterium sp.]|uniref:phosphate signaling complex PhoU family protein n=1 Tax=unclassified Cetobacterium TaxID=2630983 RepID=UPI0006491CEC|nr:MULTISPECIES: PhoU domain-containing protein [unclassified Cetobacterium]